MKKFELPVEWSKNNISPGTKFMDLMSKGLKDKEFLEHKQAKGHHELYAINYAFKNSDIIRENYL